MFRNARFSVMVALLLAGTGCAPLQQLNQEFRQAAELTGLTTRHRIVRQHQRVLPADTRLYVARGADLTTSAGDPLGQSISEALQWHFTDVVRATVDETRDQAVASARVQQADYVLYPVVLVWRDEEGAWASLRRAAREPDIVIPDLLSPADRAAVRVSLIDVQGNVVIDSSTVEVSAPWATVGGTELPRLVATSMQQYASTFWMPSVDSRRIPGQ